MSYPSEVLADSPSLYWRLNETSGTGVADSSGNSRTGTLTATGVTYSQTGAVAGDTALLFDGSAGALQTAASLNLSAAAAVTVEFWLKVAAWNDTDDLACEFSTNYNSNSGAFLIDPCSASTAFDAGMHCASGTNSIRWTRPSTGVYHYYALVFKPNTAAGAITGYLDGASWTPLSTVTTGTSDATLGNYVMYFMSRAASSLFLNGTLDEVAIYPSELSSGRIAAHYSAATQATADFELGSNGANILAADPGSATAWDSVQTNGNALTYDNSHAYGTLAAKFDNTVSVASTNALTWTTGIGTLTDWYGRVYLYATANPTSQFRIVNDSNNNFPILVNTDGTVSMYDQGGQAVVTTASIALNQWVRIEWHWVNSATVGQVELKLFNSPDSTTATETKTSGANRNTSVSTTTLNIGLNSGGNSVGPIWLDNIVAGAKSYPGPASGPASAPWLTTL